jgi:uncharacterized protein YndB with AHSA1/START domain
MSPTTTAKTPTPARRASRSDIHIVREYPHSPEKVWRVLTDPALIPLWTSTGKGGRPVGFLPVVGTRFKYVAKPMPGWSGIVECEVLEAHEPFLLRYTWLGGEKDDLTTVTNRLEPHGGGTRFTFDHTGFTGIGGFLVSAVLNSVRKKMLDVGFSAVLSDLDDEGNLRPESTLGPKL